MLLWPVLLSIVRKYRGKRIFWYGREDYLPWLFPLGFEKCPKYLCAKTDKLYSATKFPEELQDFEIFWFGVQKKGVLFSRPGFQYITAVDEKRLEHVHATYQRKLAGLGVGWASDWQTVWKENFGEAGVKDGPLLMFPGSGSTAKNWPLVKFFELAERLYSLNKETCFVLGPVEREKGIDVSDFNCIHPENLQEVSKVIRGAEAVVGNDCGPLHLAGNFGLPGVGLFGPTSPIRWGACGLSYVQSPLSCSPCTAARISCFRPVCMQEIPVERVLEALFRDEEKAGFS